LLGDEGALIDAAEAGQEAVLVVDKSPFYAEGGGQIGDRGTVSGPSGRGQVLDTTAVGSYQLHRLEVLEGRLAVGDTVAMCVDESARRATERNHTATHLVHAALKNVLGNHVGQAGSVVEPERLRFDFTHGEKLTPQQIQQIEDDVNTEIMKATPVEAAVRSMDEARAAGFVALFGEKYGDRVRTLAVGDYSKELCGGTHVANSGAIGAFRITSETAISAGTRRLEAVTGLGAMAVTRQEHDALTTMSRALKTPVDELPERVSALMTETKKLRKELAKAQAKDLTEVLADMRTALVQGDGGKSVVHKVEGLTMKDLQDLLGRAQGTFAPVASVVLSPSSQGVLVGATVTKALTDRIRAGDLVKELTSLLGGGGGGRPEMAQGKGQDVSKVDAAAELARDRLAAVGLA
jgi:alanyl-tRNA synthetase